MHTFSEKVLLHIASPTEDSPVSDELRLTAALAECGYDNVSLPLSVLRTLYPTIRENDTVTASLAYCGGAYTVTRIEAGDTRAAHYGLAVDYGSTTIIMQLVDMTTGTAVDEVKVTSGQTEYGTDILTRIIFTLEAPENARILQQATVRTFENALTLLSEKTGVDARNCPVMVLSGNTTMIHFLLRLNAWTVFASPYAPVTADPGAIFGEALGMDFGGLIYIIPAASNYVGGDIVSGLLALDILDRDEPVMFFDIGTNGELVIGCKHWLMAGAGAAGPALEGYISKSGMRAEPGAVDHITISGCELKYTTIGGEKPRGICGSGIIDLISEMRLGGWINIAGTLEPEASPRIRRTEEGEWAVVYADESESAIGEPLMFTQTDIGQYLETKAAAFTMIECLMETAGMQAEDIAHCFLSGAFAAHSDLDAAINIGIFPDLPREKYSCIKNSSLDGARRLLLDHTLLEAAQRIADETYCVQFASIPDFLIRMQAAKFIPHTDTERFPTVMAKIEERKK